MSLASAFLRLLYSGKLSWSGRDQPQRYHVDGSTTGDHLDIGGSFGVFAQAGGEGSRDAQFFGEAFSEESGCSGSLVLVSVSSGQV